MYTASVAKPPGVNFISDASLSVFTYPLDAEAEGSDRCALSVSEVTYRGVCRHGLLSITRIV
jgi:hypothetical protein